MAQHMFNRRKFVLAGASVALLPHCAQADAPIIATPRARKLITAARLQIGITVQYDPAYSRLAFPNGDVPRSKGVCTDVVIRAYRDAFGLDLQALVNDDMRSNFARYPKRWGLRTTDRNIDHRRVPNLETFLTRKSARSPIPAQFSAWQAGDVVSCLVNGSLPHIGIVSDRRASSGRPLVIHNIGSGTREEDILPDHRIIGRFRWQV
jgi:uncharacterized protein